MQPKYYGAAANYNKRGGGGLQFDRRLLMMLAVGFVVLLFIIIGIGLINAATSAPKNDLQTLVAREQSLVKFLTTYQQSVRSNTLGKITAEATLLVSSNQQTLGVQLKEQYSLLRPEDAFAAAEADTTSEAALKTASTAGQFDQKFTELLHDKLAATYTLAEKIKSSSSGTLQVGLTQTLTLMQTLDKELNDL